MTAATRFDLLDTPLGDGVHLLEASAGTGKTHTLTRIALRLLLEGKAESIGRVLLVTFTVAATDELKDRLRRLLRRALQCLQGQDGDDEELQRLLAPHRETAAPILQRAMAEFDELAVFTIHGFCKRVLEQSAFHSGAPFEVEFVEDDIPLQRRAVQDAFRRRILGGPAVAQAVAVAAGWDPEGLLAEFRAWRRHPHTELRPPPGDPEAALAELAEARREIAAVWDRADVEGYLLGLHRNKGRLGDDAGVTSLVELVDRLARDEDWAGLKEACLLGRDALRGQVNKRSQPVLPPHPVLDVCQRLGEHRTAAENALRAALLGEAEVAYAAEKARTNACTFDDLLERVAAAVQDPERGPTLIASLQDRYQAVLIDEFQDTDLRQYDIFRTAFAKGPLFLVGDPKQAIYAFRGADVHAYLEARRDAASEFTLDRNWRSHPQLVAAVQTVFERARQPFLTPGIEFRPVAPALTEPDTAIGGEDLPPLQWRVVEHGSERAAIEATVIADLTAEVVRLLQADLRVGDRPLAAGDLAVLVRKNVQAVAVQDSLRQAGVPSVIGKAGDIFDTQEMRELELLMAAVSVPQNGSRMRAFLATAIGGRTAAEIAALDGDADRLGRQVEQLEQWRRRWVQGGFVAMVEDVFAGCGLRSRMLARQDGERRLTNYLQVVEILHRAELEGRLTPEGLIQWLDHERRRKEEIDYQRRELRLESDADAVQILTVHGAKGLQYEIVFCPFLWGDVPSRKPYRYHRDGRHVVVDYGGHEDEDTAKAAAAAEELAEELRLGYVALTRARRRCYVHHALGFNKAQSSVLAYLLHQPPPDAEPAGDWLQAVRDHAKATKSTWHDDLRALVEAHPQQMGLQLVAVDRPPAVLAEPSVPAGLAPRELSRKGTDSLRVASFTSLVESGAGASLAEQPDHFDPPAAAGEDGDPPPGGAAGGMFAFARGARAGRCLHEILERVDFARLDDPATADLIRRRLALHRLERPEHHDGILDPAAAVLEMLRQLVAAELPGGLRLSQLPARARVCEWQFFASLGRTSPRKLGACFARHGQDRVADYGAGLERLPAARLHGFLTGFADMVCEHDGRYFVFDWKSNFLGGSPDDYGEPALWRCMVEHDYVLQYHLYALGLHRHLRARLGADYDYERRFGGACYVFLRAVQADSSRGIFFDRPPRALLEALDHWAEGGAR